MKKIPRSDRRAQHIATNRTVDLDGLVEFAAGKHQLVLATTRRDGRPQLSPRHRGRHTGRGGARLDLSAARQGAQHPA